MNASPVALESEPAAPPSPSRFTIDGSAELESELELACSRILHGLRGMIPESKLQAVLLGGGYGRGEGGVLRLPDGEHPYNDMDFYVIIRGSRRLNERRYHEPLEIYGTIIGSLIGVEIEFKVLSFADLERGPISMFTYDLASRQRWLWGDEGMAGRWERQCEGAAIPTAEATRLLMNRCTGLLLAKERLARPSFTPADADFVRRNIAKAELGLGDAVLAAHSLYHWSCIVRHRRLEQLVAVERTSCVDELRALHASGVDFKLHPRRSAETREELRAAWEAVSGAALRVWLHLEERRLGRPFASAREYSASAIEKCPCSSRLKNFLVNLRLLGAHPLVQGRPCIHPRQRILQALPLLLWDPEALSDPALLRRLQADLATRATDFTGLMAAYRSLWSRVS